MSEQRMVLFADIWEKIQKYLLNDIIYLIAY